MEFFVIVFVADYVRGSFCLLAFMKLFNLTAIVALLKMLARVSLVLITN